MRYKYFVLCFFILYLLTKDSNICQAQAQKAQTEVSANFLSNFGDLLDDFNDGNSINTWGYPTYYGGGNKGSGNASYIDEGYEGKCLKLDYNVEEPNSFFWYCSKLGEENLNSYNGLTFYVRGENGGEYFKVELKTRAIANQGGRSNAHLYITDYLDGGVTTSWQKVVIPFKNFANITNFNYMKELTIVFEEYQSGANGSSKIGTVYIDDIKFTNVAGGFDVIRIDHYGDKVGICALGGNQGIFTGGGGSCSITYTNIAAHSYNYGLMLYYNTVIGFAGVWTKFGGGLSGNSGMPVDFSAYNKITFWVKAKSDTENPKDMIVELKDDGGGKFTKITGITTSWQKYELNLSNFKDWWGNPLDKSKIMEQCFTFDDWRISGSLTGTVYIDEVQFEK